MPRLRITKAYGFFINDYFFIKHIIDINKIRNIQLFLRKLLS